jgi:magnesium chelatase family protein
VDVHLAVAPVRKRDLARSHRGLGFAHEAARERVARACAAQEERATRLPGIARKNARLTPADLERAAPLDPAAHRRLLDAVEHLGLSARGYHRVWRLGRTLADLEGASAMELAHVHEALTFRANWNAG